MPSGSHSSFFFFLRIYLKVECHRGKDRQKDKVFHSLVHSSNVPKSPGLDQAEARGQELAMGLP